MSNILYGQYLLEEIPNTSTLNLKGKVKSISEKSFKGNNVNSVIVKANKEWRYSWQLDNEQFFDSYGNLIEQKYFRDNSLIRRSYFKYDSLNRITEESILYRNTLYYYDAVGRIKSAKVINRQPNSISSGNEKPTDGDTLMQQLFYNSNNILIRIEELNHENTKSIMSFVYNSSGKLKLIETKYNDVVELNEFTYNSENLLSKKVWRDNSEGILEVSTFTYDINKKIASEHWVNYDDGEQDGFVDYKFEDGNEIETIDGDEDGQIESKSIYKYEFDKIGNWIRKVEFQEKKQLYHIVERKIQYY